MFAEPTREVATGHWIAPPLHPNRTCRSPLTFLFRLEALAQLAQALGASQAHQSSLCGPFEPVTQEVEAGVGLAHVHRPGFIRIQGEPAAFPSTGKTRSSGRAGEVIAPVSFCHPKDESAAVLKSVTLSRRSHSSTLPLFFSGSLSRHKKTAFTGDAREAQGTANAAETSTRAGLGRRALQKIHFRTGAPRHGPPTCARRSACRWKLPCGSPLGKPRSC